MLELPEVLTVSAQLRDTVQGKTVIDVRPPTKKHKFCWFSGDPADYAPALSGSRIVSAEGFGIFAEIGFDNGYRLCFNDGVNVRLITGEKIPGDYQLALELEGAALVFSVAMYGGIVLHRGGYDNEYYLKSRGAISPFSLDFEALYRQRLKEGRPTLSAKAFLATEQRFPGIGNGVLQDILFQARIHPKRKLESLSPEEKDDLLAAVVSVLREMTDGGGRDTEKDIFGKTGGYVTKMSKNSLAAGCPACGGAITKQAYMGGSVYFCPACQPLR